MERLHQDFVADCKEEQRGENSKCGLHRSLGNLAAPTTKSQFYPDSRSLDRHPGVQAIESDKEAVKTMAIVSVRPLLLNVLKRKSAQRERVRNRWLRAHCIDWIGVCRRSRKSPDIPVAHIDHHPPQHL